MVMNTATVQIYDDNNKKWKKYEFRGFRPTASGNLFYAYVFVNGKESAMFVQNLGDIIRSLEKQVKSEEGSDIVQANHKRALQRFKDILERLHAFRDCSNPVA